MQQNKLVQPGTPLALTIAGSDNSAGAGIQADLKTFRAFDVYGLTAVTCIVAEVPGQVESVQPVESAILASQIKLSMDSFPVAAIKTGMLYSQTLIETTCDVLKKLYEEGEKFWLVVDPVMVASSGDPLLEESAIATYQSQLLPLADLITPNLDEANVLLKRKIHSLAEMPEAARELAERFDCAVLLKGGHLELDTATDILHFDGKQEVFEAPFVRGFSTHGTGCTFAAAITAGLARGDNLSTAVTNAKAYINRAIREAYHWSSATGSTSALRH